MMSKYEYFIGKEKVDRKTFVRIVSEEYLNDIDEIVDGIAVSSANYVAGERETKRMQAEARRQGFSQNIWSCKKSLKVVRL